MTALKDKTCKSCGVSTRLRPNRRTCYACDVKRQTAWRAAHKVQVYEASRDVTYRKRFGITLGQYNLMFVAQNGVCAICQEATVRYLSIDHCHRTGKVRGLLCSKCNAAIGFLHDDPRLIERAKHYVELSQNTPGTPRNAPVGGAQK